jgi:hypothetical protein
MSGNNWDPKRIKQGSHLCCISRDQQEQLKVVLPFLFAGLQNNEKCVCVLTEETKKALLNNLLEVGLDALKCSGWGQFLFLKPENSYLKDGKFEPASMIKELSNIEHSALRSGFNGVRVTGEAKIFNAEFHGNDKLIEYESRLNEFFKKSRTSALCLYEEGSHGKDILRDAVYTHPQVVFYGVLRDNKYYVPPEIFLSKDKSINGSSYENLRDSLTV